MKSKKRMLTSVVATMIASVLIFTACAAPQAPAETTPPAQPPATTDPGTPPTTPADPPVAAEPRLDPMRLVDAVQARIPDTKVNNNPLIEGGTLRVALSSATSFTGTLDPLFTTNTVDTDAAAFIRGFAGGLLFSENEDLTIGDQGMARIEEWCHDTQSVLIVMQEEVFWHDGVQVTLDDLVFAYEVISHPDYTGTRWTAFVWNTVGTQAFRDGEVDYISGLVLSEDKMELRMYFYDWTPALQYFGFWHAHSPRHHLEHIPVADMAAHENVRLNTLGHGPFILEEYVPGESFLFVRNEDFWLGAPLVERVVFQIIPPVSAPMEAEAGNFDIIRIFPQSQYENFPTESLTNFSYVGQVTRNNITYKAFVLGYYCTETDMIVVDPTRVGSCVYLRRAMSMAVPYDVIGEMLFSGLVIPAVSNMALMHSPFFDPDLDFFRYNPEMAAQILDDAGYAMGADGWRTRPDGSELVIYWLHRNPATAAAEMRLEMELQSFHDLGINVQLYQGRTHDFQVMTDMLNQTSPQAFDMLEAIWSVGNNPNPNNLWGPYSQLNRPRYTSDRFYEILQGYILDERMWDDDFAHEAYWAWQRAMFDEVPMFPTTWPLVLNAVNNRVSGYSVSHNDSARVPGMFQWHLVGLTSDTTYVSQ